MSNGNLAMFSVGVALAVGGFGYSMWNYAASQQRHMAIIECANLTFARSPQRDIKEISFMCRDAYDWVEAQRKAGWK